MLAAAETWDFFHFPFLLRLPRVRHRVKGQAHPARPVQPRPAGGTAVPANREGPCAGERTALVEALIKNAQGHRRTESPALSPGHEGERRFADKAHT